MSIEDKGFLGHVLVAVATFSGALIAAIIGAFVALYIAANYGSHANPVSNQQPLKSPVVVTDSSQIAVRNSPEKTPDPSRQNNERQNIAIIPPTYRVIGVASNDVLHIRPKPADLKNSLDQIPPNATGIQVYGDSRPVGKNIWVNVSYQGITGWVNSKYLERQN